MPDPLALKPEAPPRTRLVLLAILLACLPSLTLGISSRLSTHTMENVALVTSQETWLRLADGDRGAWLVSTNDGVARLEKPPMLTWLNLLAWCDLDPSTATPQQLTYRARCVTAALGLMMLASIFWIGCTVADVRLAALSTVMVGSTFFFQRQARTASYDIHYVAWTALAIAAGLWAMNPIGDAPSPLRRMLGWMGCAIALFAAVFSKNPLPYLLALPPLIAAIVMLSLCRRADALWLTAAVMLSAVPAAAWYWYVFKEFPELAERELGREIRQPRPEFQPVYYYVGLLGLVAPWTLWLIGGLIEPFRMAPQRDRRRLGLLTLFWFAFIFIALSIPAAKQQRYILTIMPSVGLLVAMFFRQHDDRVREGRDDRLFSGLFTGTWIALAAASLIAPWFMLAQDQYLALARHLMDDPERVVAPLAWPLAIALSIALLGLCVYGLRTHVRRPWTSAMAMGAWMLVLMTVFWKLEAGAPTRRVQPFVDEAARIRGIVGNAPLRSLRWGGNDFFLKLNEEFRFYYGRLIQRVGPDDLDAWLADQRDGAFIIARSSRAATDLLTQHGFVLVDHAQVDKSDNQEIWRWRPDSQ